jgi:hypothetical protein
MRAGSVVQGKRKTPGLDVAPEVLADEIKMRTAP